jgi:hypothetical protein
MKGSYLIRRNNMPTKKIIEFDDLLLEADIYALIKKLEGVSAHIYNNIPNEILLLPNGEPNVRSRWGAIYFHCRAATATLRAFL